MPGSNVNGIGTQQRLHRSLSDELARNQQMALEIFDLQSALAQANARLAGLQASEKRARHLAQHDGLTLLPNRRHFLERLAAAIGRVRPQRRALAVLYLDLDDFKPINDRHGHAVGDRLLRVVATRLKRTLRAGDTVGRIGGDEFACLLAGPANRERLCQLAEALFAAVAAPVKVGALELTVHPSIGIATCPADGVSAVALLGHADAAMYLAKRQRSRYAIYEPCAPAGLGVWPTCTTGANIAAPATRP